MYNERQQRGETTSKIAFTASSNNAKVGRMPVSMSHKDTCPDACSFKGKGCYAKYGNVSIHWNNISKGKRGVDIDTFCQHIKKLPKNTIWRHNVAGDLFGNNDEIDLPALKQLVQANKGKRGFTYTHKPLTKENVEAITYANSNGFTINVSTDTLEQADAAMSLNIAPVVTVLPLGAPKVSYTKGGNRVVKCPADGVKITCLSCAICTKKERDYIIGFEAHGAGKKYVDIIAKSG